MIPREQEPDVVSSRTVLIVMGGVVAATAVGVVVAWLLTGEPGRAGSADRPADPGDVVPGEVNAIETAPFSARAQGLEDRDRAQAWLSTYGWVDRATGLVHIPIDRAIDLYLDRARGGGEAP